MSATVAPFAVRGAIEGFYGVYYTFPERDALICDLGRHGFNLYIYAPKNDRQHRSRWTEPYPERILAQFGQTVAVAAAAGVTFCYALSPGKEICYSGEADFARVTAKLGEFYARGVRAFSLCLDDIAAEFHHEADRRRYASYAAAHADLCNRVYAWLVGQDPVCTLSMCPTDYHGRPPFSPYLHELGRRLNPAIDVFYTGAEICSPTITQADAAAFSAALGRPPILWDNYPVNDLTVQGELHIGPLRDRAADLYCAVKGCAANLMIQPAASRVPLWTYGRYLADPHGYDPERAWAAALAEEAGEDSVAALRLFAENSLYSCLGTPDTQRLEPLVAAALAALYQGEIPSASPAVQALDIYLTQLDEACYHLRNRMENLPLRNDLLPWLEQLENWYCASRRALTLLYGKEAPAAAAQTRRELQEWFGRAIGHHKRYAGQVLRPLCERALAATAQPALVQAR